MLKSPFLRAEKQHELTLADIPEQLLAEIKRNNELEFYASFEAYKLVPPPIVVKDPFEKWFPYIALGINLIILIKVFLIK